MKRLARWLWTLGGLRGREALGDRLDEEVRFHLEQSVERHRQAGLSPEEARRRAAIEFGARQRFREEARDEFVGRRLGALAADLRYAVRSLAKAPAFTVASLLTLGLGIGATTLIFSITDHVVLRPLGYPESDRLVLVREVIEQLEATHPSLGANASHYLEWRRSCTGCEVMGALRPVQRILSSTAEPVSLEGARVSAELLPMLGASAAVGRLFSPSDDRTGAPPVVVLSHSFWRERQGADPAIIGQSLVLDGIPSEVVGVLAAGFRLPKGRELGSATMLAADPAFFAPLALTSREATTPGEYDYAVIVRRDSRRSPAELQSELDRIQRELAARSPDRSSLRSRVIPLQEQVVGTSRSTLLLLLAAVGAVLLIVCVNVANLMLARNAVRRREAAVRVALGAGRGRLVQQALTESLALAVAGGVLGVAVAAVGLDGLLRLAPSDLPRLAEIRLDGRILLVSLAVAVSAGLLFGTVPAFRMSRTDPADVLKGSSRTSTTGRSGRRTRNLLVAAQVGLSTFLLAATGLLVSSFIRVLRVDKGFTAERVLALDLAVPVDRYPANADRAQLYDDLLTRVAATAGVTSAAIGSVAPLEGDRQVDLLSLEHDPKPELERPPAAITAVSPDYFSTLGIRIRRGRSFQPSDRDRLVVILSERAAQSLWPGQDPIGNRVVPGSNLPVGEVVGTVGEVKSMSLEATAIATAYVPITASAPSEVALLIRAAGRPKDLVGAVRAALAEVGPTVAMAKVRTLEEVVSGALARRRFQVLILLLFAVSAVATASVGIAGIISHTLAQRSNEIAVRLALGARPGDVHRLVWREEMRPVGVGLGLGALASLGVASLFSDLLFEVRPADPTTLVLATATLGLVAALACWLPARRATSSGPARALRMD
jgi:predicted permease